MDVYEALADRVRRQIVELLSAHPLPAGQVAEAFGDISRPAVSRHLRLLREAGLVQAELVGRQRIYRANIAPLSEIESWIAGMRTGWDQHLDALATEVYRTRLERQRRETGEKTAARHTPTDEEQIA